MNRSKIYPAADGLPQFTLVRKKIKRIHMRFNEDNTLLVSAPERVTLAEIKKLISDNMDWINSTLSRRMQREAARPETKDGGSMTVAGREYPLHITAGSRSSDKFTESGITLTVSQPESEECIAAAVERFMKKQAKLLFEESLERMFPLIAPLGAPRPSLRIRRMTSRWGTCNVKTKVITLNLYLVRAPKPLIDSVVLHELIHLINFPHDARFHNISAKLMPDYKERRKKLNSLDIIY